MAIIIKTHLLLFILLISTLFLASSAAPLTIRRTRILGDRVQKCKLPICIATYNNSKSYKDPRDEYFDCWQSCQTSEDPEECGVECGRRLDKKLRKQALGKKQHSGEEAKEEETEPSADFNPYHFPRYMLKPRFVAEQGGYFVLDRFARLSKLLRGAVENYRLAVFQAAPGTFVLPHHIDAESIFVVWSGSGALALVMKDKKELFEIKDGDVIRVPAGATTYFINDHKSDVLSLTQLIQPVNIPDQFEEFFPAGYEAVNSYFSLFSNDILTAAFDISGEQLEKAFGQQRTEGMIIKAPEEQLRALSKQASPPWWRKLIPWWSTESDSKFSLQGQELVHSNDYGRFFEFTPQEFKQLKDMHVSFALADIKPGAMMVPHYNSKATYLVMVVNGTGWFEMVSPHFTIPDTSEEMEDQEEHSGQFTKVNCKLSLGDVLVIPAGHPVAIVAQNNNDGSPNQNLIMIGFGINAENNMRNFLAGQEGNIMKQIEREAMQLAFGQEMEQILSNQNQSYFVPMTEKSRQKQHKKHSKGRSHP